MDAPLLPALPGYDNPQLIAHGTTALVFRAIQTTLNRPVAIKVITVDTSAVPVNAARELATTVQLSSQPHIVSIIDYGVTPDDRPYIVMEYCEGGSYGQILRQGGPLPIDDVVEVGIKIGEALHAAHQVGIVHRDVKPSNILRSRFGPALTDFGIARAPDELGSTLTREMMTPHHASPEALLHQAQSGLSDVYSLASTLWTLLVGHPPFVDPAKPGMDMYAFRDRVLHDRLPPMERDDVPAWLVTELVRAMSKLPAQRHGSAKEFAEALRRATLGLPAAPPPYSDPSAPAGSVPTQSRGQVHTGGMPAEAWPMVEESALPAYPPAATAVPTVPPAAVVAGPAAPAPLVPPPPRGAPPIPPPATPFSAPPIPPADEPSLAAPLPRLDPLPPLLPAPPSLASPPSPPAPLPTLDPHPLSRPDTEFNIELDRPDPHDEGGWLGPTTVATDPVDELGGTTTHPYPTRRFDERSMVGPSSSRRGGLVAVLAGVTLIALASAALLSLKGGGGGPGATPTDLPTNIITAQSEGKPIDVKITADHGTAVTLAWADPTPGRVGFFISVKTVTGELLPPAATPQGVTTIDVTGLKRDVNYCFTVGAIYNINTLATADDVCTKR